MKISNLKIGVRMGAAFAAVIMLTALMTGFGIRELFRVADAKQTIISAAYTEKLTQEWLEGIATNSVRTYARAKINDPADQAYFADAMKKVSKRVSEIQNELGTLIISEEGKRLLAEVGEKRKAYFAVRDEVFNLKKAGDGSAAEMTSLAETKMLPAMNVYIDAVKKVVAYQAKLFDKANVAIDEVIIEARHLLMFLGSSAVTLGAFMAWLLTKSITKPLASAVALAQTVAAGDLTSKIEVNSRDELGQLLAALKIMNDSLLKTVLEVRSGTETIATASQQIASGNLDLSSRTEEQASSLEETASSMEELTATVKQNADNAHQANTLAEAASQVATKGGTVIGQVVGTMSEITDSAKKIADIINVIDGIAFQTNILALNAAVEAARAGEQGRGFAVVASEVRTLAQRSASAAKEIKALIDNSVDRVQAGSQLVSEAGTTMHEIIESVSRVTDVMNEISAASREQTAGIEQVNQAISQMDQVTQQNAALVEEAAAASESMQEQAARLAGIVNMFKIDGYQSQSSRAASGNPPSIDRPLMKKSAQPQDLAVNKSRTGPKLFASTRSRDGNWEEF